MENFENVKVGDLVIYDTGGCIYSQIVIAKVTQVTPKQFVVGYDRFRKCDGMRIGYPRRKCRYATEEDIRRNAEEYKYNLLLDKCKAIKFSDLSLDQLERILAIANEIK